MAFYVHKYGGTSVGSPEKIIQIAKKIKNVRDQGHSLVVVVSAMGATTDELISLAQRVSAEPPHREMDMLLTAGERISMSLLSIALADQGVPAISFTGSQSGIVSDSSHRRARIKKVLGDRVRAALADKKVAIVAGFQGVSQEKEITTLGRGGSDTTAVALAAALRADECEIYTDVDGVFSADPRDVKRALIWKKLPYDLMIEMANRGAGVLHPRSVQLAKKYGVRLWVKNSLNDRPGTQVMGRDMIQKNTEKNDGLEDYSVTGVMCDDEKLYLEVSLSRTQALSALWSEVKRLHLTTLAPVLRENTLCCYIERDAMRDWKKHLEQLSRDGFVSGFEMKENIVPLSVVGDCFSIDSAVFQRVIEKLAEEKILVTIGASSALSVTVGVPAAECQRAVQILHRELVEGKA